MLDFSTEVAHTLEFTLGRSKVVLVSGHGIGCGNNCLFGVRKLFIENRGKRRLGVGLLLRIGRDRHLRHAKT